MWNEINPLTRRSAFHTRSVFHARSAFHKSRKGFISLKKARSYERAFFWWGKVDSNHRRHSQQIYSLSPLATREFPHILELVIGFEPTTCWLQISCTAIVLHQRISPATKNIIPQIYSFVNRFLKFSQKNFGDCHYCGGVKQKFFVCSHIYPI